jgi:hypothetical protein
MLPFFLAIFLRVFSKLFGIMLLSRLKLLKAQASVCILLIGKVASLGLPSRGGAKKKIALNSQSPRSSKITLATFEVNLPLSSRRLKVFLSPCLQDSEI